MSTGSPLELGKRESAGFSSVAEVSLTLRDRRSNVRRGSLVGLARSALGVRALLASSRTRLPWLSRRQFQRRAARRTGTEFAGPTSRGDGAERRTTSTTMLTMNYRLLVSLAGQSPSGSKLRLKDLSRMPSTVFAGPVRVDDHRCRQCNALGRRNFLSLSTLFSVSGESTLH